MNFLVTDQVMKFKFRYLWKGDYELSASNKPASNQETNGQFWTQKSDKGPNLRSSKAFSMQDLFSNWKMNHKRTPKTANLNCTLQLIWFSKSISSLELIILVVDILETLCGFEGFKITSHAVWFGTIHFFKFISISIQTSSQLRLF